MKRSILLLVALLASAQLVRAQIPADAFTLSHHFPSGSARFSAMGGSMGAFGGDPSAMFTNPAGLGLYRGSEFSITPGLQLNQTKTSFGRGSTDNRTSFLLGNLAYVATLEDFGGAGALKSLTFGFGYNTLSEFGNNTLFRATGMESSLLDMWAGTSSNWVNPDPKYHDPSLENPPYYNPDELLGQSVYSYLAYNQGLIGLDNADPAIFDRPEGYYSVAEYTGYGQSLTRKLEQRGRVGEWSFSMAGNIDDQFYFGLTLGVQDIEYKEWMVHRETGGPGSELDFFDYMQDFKMTGYGVNLKLGAIYRPTDMIRLGLAYHTPTWMNLSQEYQPGVYSHWLTLDSEGHNEYEQWDELAVYDFKARTPGRWIASTAVQFGPFGMLNVDYERIDYSNMKFRADRSSNLDDEAYFDAVNLDIDDTYRAVNNLRVGAEVKTGLVSWRGGYGIYGNPYREGTVNRDASYFTVSGGVGFRLNNFYADLGYTHLVRKESFSLYDAPTIVPDGPDAGKADYNPVISKWDTSNGRLLLTLGFRL